MKLRKLFLRLQFSYVLHQPEMSLYLQGSLSAQSMQWLHRSECCHIPCGDPAAYSAKCGGEIPELSPLFVKTNSNTPPPSSISPRRPHWFNHVDTLLGLLTIAKLPFVLLHSSSGGDGLSVQPWHSMYFNNFKAAILFTTILVVSVWCHSFIADSSSSSETGELIILKECC